MTEPDALARLHRAAFTVSRPWHAAEIADLLNAPHVTLFRDPHGFALTRLVAGEAELLTIAVDPAHHRQGIAETLLRDWLASLEGRAQTAFLEVAADNAAAQSLYAKIGFGEVARRAGYYARANATDVDAVIMRLALTKG
ncbi:GNAT family N-acetyltransferase [uncultured Sulfitobacter sp.]|uniref:GNAT family N-acetyltransferase n=1 Tax=uncultured Sulfitobacter sp. TaxID=191468 RepID=UPI00261A59BD|nr:GNAT family N-acetyltransferase [uncultured Sulfitobacter sp.]